jgi:hypothetical protein
MSITEGLRVGDVVRHSRTMKVTYAAEGDYVELQDAKNPSIRIGLFPTHEGSDKIEVVEKAKPKVGDVLTGDEIAAASWRTGTVVEGVNSGRVYMLNADRQWAVSSGVTLTHKELSGPWRAKLLHVA